MLKNVDAEANSGLLREILATYILCTVHVTRPRKSFMSCK